MARVILEKLGYCQYELKTEILGDMSQLNIFCYLYNPNAMPWIASRALYFFFFEAAKGRLDR